METNVSATYPNTTVVTDHAEDIGQSQTLEAYTVVLSVTCHLLSLFFGGGSSVTVLLAIIKRSNISKYSYLLIITFLIGCCCLNFIYTPLEVADLLMYHSYYRHPMYDFVAAKTVIYLLLLALFNMVIVFLAAEGLIRLSHCYPGILQRTWPLISTVMTVAISFILAGILMGPTAEHREPRQGSYVITHGGVRTTLLTLFIFLLCTATIVFVILIIQTIRANVYWEDGRPHLRQKKLKFALPEFLISQSNNACEEGESGFDNDQAQSRTPSPSTPKLLTVCEQAKGEDASPISELPQNTPTKPSGNRLGINMSNVLGRRRHTICQISDSSSPATAPADPITKAKQYNYVRKFSVDVSALQAQLQNPKIFKDAPFQSDIDLAKRADSAKPPTPKPLLPLKPLKSNFEEKDEQPALSVKAEKPTPSAFPIPPPPVIMVSNEDVVPEHEEIENNSSPVVTEGLNGKTETFEQQPAVTIQKPASLPLKETTFTDDFNSAPTLESAITDASGEAESEGQKIIRLAFGLALTFIITTVPVVITELLRHRLSEHAFVNISTCTVAVSTIQTIVYPNLLACIDDVVHKAVQKLKGRAKRLLACNSKLDHPHTNVEETSSTSQV